MATLFNTKISDTYEGLIKTSDNGVIGAVEKNLTDGLGNASTLSIGTSSASFTGTLDLTNATVVGLPTGAVDSVNGQTGVVVLTSTNIAEGTNLYFTDARVAANSAVTLNTAKVGITTSQATDITNNNAKISFDSVSSTKLNGIEAGAQVNTVNSVNSLTGAVSLGLLELDDVGSDGSNGQVLTTNGSGSFTFTTVAAGGAVDSVNGQTGTVVLDTDDVSEGATNLYYTDARVSANSSVAANTAKVGITSQQATDITNNNAKVGITTSQANEIAANTLKVGITTQQATDITNNNAKISFTSTGTDNYLSKWDSNTLIDSIIFDNGNNVGIGTNAPTNFGSGKLLTIQSESGGDYGGIITKTDSVTGQMWSNENASNLFLGTRTDHPIVITTNNVEKVRVDTNGNVGIGTTSPNVKLEVASQSSSYAAKFTHSVAEGYSPASILLEAGQSVTRGQGMYHYNTVADENWFTGVPYGVSSKKWIVANKYSTVQEVDTAQLTNALLTIDSDTSNVGIGTTTPADKLSVVSTVGILGDNTNQGLLKLYCEASTHYVGIKGGVHSGGSSYTLQLPNTLPNVANQILESNATGTLSWIATPSGGGGSQIKSYHFCSNHSTNSTSNYYQFRSNSPNSMTGRNISWTSWNYQYWTDLIMASNCFLKTVIVRSLATTWSSGLQVKMRIYKNSTVLEYDGSFVTSTGSGNTGNVIFNLTDSDTSFLQGDVVAIGFNATSTMGGIASVMDFETT